jgi:hypothetical protein
MVQRNHEKIRWYVPTRRGGRIKIRERTCECKATVYELCQVGGLAFVRRMIRDQENPLSHESGWLAYARVEKIWYQILTGQAR